MRIGGPLISDDRIGSIDVLRGLALLGIVIVNAAYFGLPLGATLAGASPSEPFWDRITSLLVSVFLEFKFISIFSLLFGFGLAMQRSRRIQAGRGFAVFGVRRMVILAIFGTIHALGLWFGDVLFVYSIVGLVLIPMLMLNAGNRLVLALLAFGWAALSVTGFGFLNLLVGDMPDPDSVDPGLRGFEAMMEADFNPAHPAWTVGEIAAFRDGPFLDAMSYRGVSWGTSIIMSAISFGWQVLGMALIGSWMHDRGFFGPDGAQLRRRLATTILPIGLALSMTLGAVHWFEGRNSILGLAMTPVQTVSAVLMSIGIVSLVSLLVDSSRMPGASLFARVGRMSLTAYLLESVIFVSLMAHWGLGWFDQVSRPGLVGLAFLVYLCVALFSILWSRLAPMGPVEWIWRQGSYLGLGTGSSHPPKA